MDAAAVEADGRGLGERADLRGEAGALRFAEPVDPAELGRATASALFGPYHDAAALRLQPNDVKRLGLPADLEPAPLADREVDEPLCRPSTRPRRRRSRLPGGFGRTFFTTDA
jgi:hypothetical protein